jgi:molybdopterin-guanine dinucleotide biosynthesis protein B
MTPIVSIVGKSDAGKTALIETIQNQAARLSRAPSSDAHRFDIDYPGRIPTVISRRADWTIIGSSDKSPACAARSGTTLADPRRSQRGPHFTEITREARCRIEVSRRALTTELISRPDELLAVAADYPIELGVPVYDLDDAAGLVDLIEREVLKQ